MGMVVQQLELVGPLLGQAVDDDDEFVEVVVEHEPFAVVLAVPMRQNVDGLVQPGQLPLALDMVHIFLAQNEREKFNVCIRRQFIIVFLFVLVKKGGLVIQSKGLDWAINMNVNKYLVMYTFLQISNAFHYIGQLFV